MEMNKTQKDMIMKLLSYNLEQQKDIVVISQILNEFEQAFGKEIPEWKERLKVSLKNTLSGYVSLHVLESWK